MTSTPNGPTLAELVDAYAEADADEKAATDRKKDLRDQLLLVSTEVGNEGDLTGTRSVVKVTSTTSWRLDSGRLKTEQPALYAAYAKQSSSTRLTVVPR